MYQEKNFQSDLTYWCKRNWTFGSAGIELKICHAKTFNFKKIAPHQTQALLDSKNYRLVHKLSDSARGFLPYDMFILNGSQAYLALLYYKPRRPKEVIFIDIDVLLTEIKNCGKKNLSEDRAKLIASKVISL